MFLLDDDGGRPYIFTEENLCFPKRENIISERRVYPLVSLPEKEEVYKLSLLKIGE